MTAQTCATPSCDNPVAARQGTTGRPPIYCSTACRHARRLTHPQPRTHPTNPPPHQTTNEINDHITVEISQDPDHPTPMRSWTVTIHRGDQSVTVSHELGRFTATALTTQLQQLLQTPDHQEAHTSTRKMHTPSEGIP
jgi:hypothetical protein